jgi:hypothetical protein
MATDTTPNAVETPVRPAHQIRCGKIIASIWLNGTKHGPLYNVTFERIYLHNGKWNYSDNFGRDDLPCLAFVANLAWEWIHLQSKEEEATF